MTLQSSIQTSDIDNSAADGSLTSTSSALVLKQNLYRGGETELSNQANYGRSFAP